MKIRLQCRGRRTLLEVEDDATFAQLLNQIAVATSIESNKFVIKAGFPPKKIEYENTSKKVNSVFKAGEALIVEPIEGLSEQVSSQISPSVSTSKHNSSRTSTVSADIPASRSEPVAGSRTRVTVNSNLPELGRGSQDSTLPPEVRVPDRGVLVLRVQPDDNSCLFRAIGYLCMRTEYAVEELRALIASTIQAKPDDYNDAVLGMKRDLYCTKMNSSDTWGGEIEMKILSDYFTVQIASIDCKTGHIYRYGEMYNQCIYIVYSGIHYDALALSPTENAPPDWDQTQFESYDKVVEQSAITLVGVLRKRNYFTDTATFDLKCNDCETPLKGEKGAQEHAARTGHVRFGEYAA